MTSYTLVISPVARDDLKKIYQYGALNWGVSRATRYLDGLKYHFWRLSEYPQLGTERGELLSAMRSLAVESHVIFYRTRKQTLEIVRILHGRQDPQRHFK